MRALVTIHTMRMEESRLWYIALGRDAPPPRVTTHPSPVRIEHGQNSNSQTPSLRWPAWLRWQVSPSSPSCIVLTGLDGPRDETQAIQGCCFAARMSRFTGSRIRRTRLTSVHQDLQRDTSRRRKLYSVWTRPTCLRRSAAACRYARAACVGHS